MGKSSVNVNFFGRVAWLIYNLTLINRFMQTPPMISTELRVLSGLFAWLFPRPMTPSPCPSLLPGSTTLYSWKLYGYLIRIQVCYWAAHKNLDGIRRYYKAVHMRPGMWIEVFSRPMFVYDCEGVSTRAYLKQQFGDIDYGNCSIEVIFVMRIYKFLDAWKGTTIRAGWNSAGRFDFCCCECNFVKIC